MNPIQSVREHLTTALAGLGLPVGVEYAAMPTPPQIVLRMTRYAPGTFTGWQVEMDVACIVPLAGAGAAVTQLDQLVADTITALNGSNTQTLDVGGYQADQDTSTLTAVIPTITVWKD